MVDVERTDLIAALVAKAGQTTGWESRPEAVQALRSWSTTDLAREYLALGSDNPTVRDFTRQKLLEPEAVRAAVSGGEMSSFFDAGISATVQSGFALERDATAGWVTTVDALNFKDVQTYVLALFGTLKRLPRGGTAESVDFSLSAESWAVARYATKMTIDEQDLIDDPRLRLRLLATKQMGASARRLVPDLVFAKLLENPTLSADSVALFHATHGNLGTAALAEASLEAAIAVIGGQTFTDRHGNPIHVNARSFGLIVPPALAGEARKLVRAIQLGDGQDIRVISESRISATGVVDPASGTLRTGSATCWLLVAGPTAFPSIIVGNLNGRRSPSVRSTVLQKSGQYGQSWDVMLDAGVGVADYRGLYFSSGDA